LVDLLSAPHCVAESLSTNFFRNEKSFGHPLLINFVLLKLLICWLLFSYEKWKAVFYFSVFIAIRAYDRLLD